MGLKELIGRVRLPLKPEVVEEVAKSFSYRKEWKCECGANLRIRSRADHSDKASNYTTYPADHPRAGQSIVPPALLTWDGLAEERGWIVGAQTVCPACQAGMTIAEYRDHLRRTRG